ncbi:hypothetical protein GGR57DRAFT_35412 [Xylariaceae sp. FL1272]|nr:hypothetical protein GGR57DRAFT_35412 [Xylariaceae sp. FL1272]
MENRTASIPDDWEHVDDDTFSVRSLPASDDEFLNPSPTSESRPASPTVDASCDTLRDLRYPPHKPQPHPGHRDSVDQNEKRGNEETDDILHVREINGNGIDKDKLKQVLSTEINPKTLHSIALSVGNQLESMANVMGDFCSKRPRLDADIYNQFQSLCWVIYDNLADLKEILRSYSVYCKSKERSIMLPIDPDLHKWLGGLAEVLTNLKKSINEPASFTESLPCLKEHRESLNSYNTQIEVFLPVMQADLAEFHTAGLYVLENNDHRLATAQSEPTSTTNRHGHQPPGNNISHLRRELYRLRDAICSYLEEAHGCLKLVVANAVDRAALETATSSYGDIKKSLEVMLSNHASDWIDYSTAGGLTYPEFCRLDPDTIRLLIPQLHEVKNDLLLAAQQARESRYMNDPDGHLENDGVTLRASTIHISHNIAAILLSLFRLRHEV